jgi:2-polyprenyl-6-methoxyphenol hydroxylase-like FAD-dependent oxidoreductase
MADSQKKPVLIIGGGVVGLSLAHGLAKVSFLSL